MGYHEVTEKKEKKKKYINVNVRLTLRTLLLQIAFYAIVYAFENK